MKNIFDVSIGDYVWIDGDSSFCTAYVEQVTNIKLRYDEKTGQPYEVICCGKHKFDGRTGNKYKVNGYSPYYLVEIATKEDYDKDRML